MEINIITECYRELSGEHEFRVIPMPQSGSDRKYFRITKTQQSVIGVYNSNREENDAFTGFSAHFRKTGLPVPEVYGYFQARHVYFLEDLGDINLFSWMSSKNSPDGFDEETISVLKSCLDFLVLFQVRGIRGLDLDLCYPYRSFDRQSMMWDMNYFKYMFLKLMTVPFNESRLEKDFDNLAAHLLRAGQDYFLYRDFQSANIMIREGAPWFIDYQGGRLGAPQYDAASLLFDAKTGMNDDDRSALLDYYSVNFCRESGMDEKVFRLYFPGFSMIRLMQALGAFGFRGLYEQKPTFTESIVPAVKLLEDLTEGYGCGIELPELFSTIKAIRETRKYNNLAVRSHL
ncbi:MAG: phosphotransferase [Bacteroidales bacterium]|jgi:aminoglycoside/choline kinase family phosphotransferase|nr:phosphotransferase [Bacteroidales bacterium]